MRCRSLSMPPHCVVPAHRLGLRGLLAGRRLAMCHSYGYLFHTSIVQFSEEQLHSNGIESHTHWQGGGPRSPVTKINTRFLLFFFEPPKLFSAVGASELSERNCALEQSSRRSRHVGTGHR